MKRSVSSSLCLALLRPALSAWGMSRLFDGDARVRMQDRALCFGGAAFKSPGLFFNRTLKVDERQVTVHYIEIAREPYEPFWSSASIEPTQGVSLHSDTCFAYGQAFLPGGARRRTGGDRRRLRRTTGALGVQLPTMKLPIGTVRPRD